MSEGIQRDRKSAYEQVERFIQSRTVNHAEQMAVRETELKTSLCANGSLTPKQVNTALKALGEQEVIQYGSGWITPVISKEYHREAVAYVVENSTGDVQEFVSVANQAIATHDWKDV